jgi:hypothetical protein
MRIPPFRENCDHLAIPGTSASLNTRTAQTFYNLRGGDSDPSIFIPLFVPCVVLGPPLLKFVFFELPCVLDCPVLVSPAPVAPLDLP